MAHPPPPPPAPMAPAHHNESMVEVVPEPEHKHDKKDKKKNDELVELRYKGYMLERADPHPGHKLSWERVGTRPLPFDEIKLVAIAKAHRLKTGTGPAALFRTLRSNQQGVIDRLISQHILGEKNPNADWVLYDLQRFGVTRWGRDPDIRRMQVILKRQDKTLTKPADKAVVGTGLYQIEDIIDLSQPLVEPKKHKDKSKGEDKKDDEIVQIVETHSKKEEGPWKDVPFGDPIPDPLPPGAIRVEDYNKYHPSARREGNPFDPLYGTPSYPGPLYQLPPDPRDAKVPYRAPTPPSPSRSRLVRIERKVDGVRDRVDGVRDRVDDMQDRLQHLHFGSDSGESGYEEDSIFDPPLSGGSFTPPSTPPQSEYRPSGSLHGRSRSRPRYYRDEHYDVEPGQARRRDGRHRHHYDDFPPLRAAERRSRPQLTLAAEGFDDAEWDARHWRRREDRRRPDLVTVREAPEPPRRRVWREHRRYQ